MPQKRLAQFDVGRCLCNFMVVFLHSSAATQYCEVGSAEGTFWRVLRGLAGIAMPALFFISGYFMEAGYTRERYPGQMWRRVKRLLVPFVAWNILFAVIYLLAAPHVPRLAERVWQFKLDTLGGFVSKTAGLMAAPLDGPLWFMRYIFALALVFPVFDAALKHWRGAPAAVIVAGYFAAIHAFGWEGATSLSYPPYGMAMFILGAWFRARQIDIPQFVAAHAKGACVIAALCITYVCATRIAGVEEPYWVRQAMTLPQVATAMAMAVVLTPFLAERAVFKHLQKISFFAYCGHFLFCGMLMHSLAPLLGGVGTGKETLLVLAFMAGVPLMAGVHFAWERLPGKTVRIFDGTL